MPITPLENAHNSMLWSDTNKTARIRRNIGDVVRFVFTGDSTHIMGIPGKKVRTPNPDWIHRPMELAEIMFPYDKVGTLPRDTEVSFYVVEKQLEANPPYFEIQYVTA